ncbi:hypothetical protein KHO57_gp145 [Mycobacterium phage Phabba]|uniref:Lipoprotein n=1 Tax=Mycobacterium phage Phabba TaxID=2027899 RepID=A0A249XSP8_9CAUD|nr:hypothetical protein KHO57_gp145 [Mycobacterium phage Phabba]ASZ74759.1 hypothetical protein SEA_PHABBA_222 [Mycobacterium phage Phabba]
MKRVGLALSAVSISLALVLTGCGSSGVKNRPGTGNTHVEDCDFDDMLEGDSDCDSKKKTSTSKKTTTVKPTTKAATPTKKASSSGSGSKKK